MEAAFNQIGTQFLINDAELALSFLRLAQISPQGLHRQLAYWQAARAYRCVCELMCRFEISDEDAATLGSMLLEIKTRLEAASW